MILVSKGLASGLPISAVIADDEVAASWGPGRARRHFTAGALACATANATLDMYESEPADQSPRTRMPAIPR